MKIARSPYHARIAPNKKPESYLWQCVIHREGSTDVVVRRDATSKEDAWCTALLELVRLSGGDKRAALQSLPRL